MIYGYHSSQVAYPVGPDKDSYTITSSFQQDIETEEVKVECKLIKNYFNSVYDPTIKWKPGTRFQEFLCKGTYKECIAYLMDNVMNTQKEWVRDERSNYVYPE